VVHEVVKYDIDEVSIHEEEEDALVIAFAFAKLVVSSRWRGHSFAPEKDQWLTQMEQGLEAWMVTKVLQLTTSEVLGQDKYIDLDELALTHRKDNQTGVRI